MWQRITCALVAFSTILTRAKCENNASIVIVGAGASGIAAATRLLENGFVNVKLIEAENRIGGRIQSVHFGDAFVDFGAEYCHGERDNIVFSMADKFAALKSDKPEYVLYYSGDGLEVGIDVHELLFNLTHSIGHRKKFNASDTDSCIDLLSEGLCLKRQFDKLLNTTKPDYRPLLNLSYQWLRSYKSATESCTDLDDVSLVSEYEECEGDQMLGWRGLGFKTILDIMMRKHPAQTNQTALDLDILLNSTVSVIANQQNGRQLDVVLEDGRNYPATHVIFTSSLGVLKANHKTLFVPHLPREKTFAIDHLGYGVIVKIAMYFEKSWWMIHGPRMWGCIWSANHNKELDKQNLTWVRQFTAITAAPGNPQVLLAWFSGESTPDIEQLSDHDVSRGIRFVLSKCFVNYFGIDMPTKTKRSRWWSNPNFLGTFSYDSVRGLLSGHRNLRELLGNAIVNEDGVPSLLFAGEATHSTMFATVHGAIEAGYREADRLIDYYRSRA